MIYLNDMRFERKKAEEFIFSFKLYDLHVSVITFKQRKKQIISIEHRNRVHICE